jgi:hypothetical protein
MQQPLLAAWTDGFVECTQKCTAADQQVAVGNGVMASRGGTASPSALSPVNFHLRFPVTVNTGRILQGETLVVGAAAKHDHDEAAARHQLLRAGRWPFL